MLLRDPSHFQWNIIPIFLLVLYVYADQIAARRWSVLLAGMAFWLMDWINEIWNALLAHFSHSAPAWGTPGNSSLILLSGLNIEITLMFAVMGLLSVRILPENPQLSFWNINNRFWLASINSLLCVMVELFLHHIGLLTWAWPWWNSSFPLLIWLIGYMPFFLVAYWVHDMHNTQRQLHVVLTLAGGVSAALIVFGAWLHWL